MIIPGPCQQTQDRDRERREHAQHGADHECKTCELPRAPQALEDAGGVVKDYAGQQDFGAVDVGDLVGESAPGLEVWE